MSEDNQRKAACPSPTDLIKQLEESQSVIGDLADGLAASYEEISLLYKVLENLYESDDIDQLIGLVLDWLAEVVPAEGVALQLLPDKESISYSSAPQLLTRGHCPVDGQRFTQVTRQLKLETSGQPFVANVGENAERPWQFDEINELVVVPIFVAGRVYGWLACLNHTDDGWFGTTEARLLQSVATILGIHREKLQLCRRNAELRASNSDAQNRIGRLENRLDGVTQDLASFYHEVSFTHEGISLLTKLAANLSTATCVEDLIQLALDSLIRMLPVEGVALQLWPDEGSQSNADATRSSTLRTRGDFPLNSENLDELLHVLGWDDREGPLNVNRHITVAPDAPPVTVRQLIVVPISQQTKFAGRLVALNHLKGRQFDTVAVGLLSAVGELISIRCSLEPVV